MKRFTVPTALLLLLASGTALAHPGHDGGLAAGLAHPFTGLDHLLAMVAVGLWAAQQTVITSYSIHYTKLYDPPPCSWPGW